MLEREIVIEKNNRLKKTEISNNVKYLVLFTYAFIFILFGCLVDSPKNIINGLIKIIKHSDILISDYIGVGGLGATFVNAGVLTLIAIFILYFLKIKISGVSIASIFLMTGFGMFGKNILNIWLIIIGVYLYSKVQKDKFSKYIYIAFFGTSMSPIITEFLFHIDKPLWIRISLSVLIGLSIGFILPPVSVYLIRVHQGFNLYNIGFASGIIGTILVSVFKSYGFNPESNLIWSSNNNIVLGVFLFIVFISMIITGFFFNTKSLQGFSNVFQYSGRLITDFVVMEGFGITLINMGLNGLISMCYIILVGGELNGPTIGGILTIVGFSAFGKHAKNIIPIFIGVLLGSVTKIWNISDPPILLAALFGTGLAPIAGQFGWKYGVLAGYINSSVVLNVGILHGGLNLYNTGFSAGLVAAMMIPIIESFRKENAR